MNTNKIRWLLWAGCLGGAILFAGDMLYYGAWGSARAISDDVWNSIMASVPLWRHPSDPSPARSVRDFGSSAGGGTLWT